MKLILPFPPSVNNLFINLRGKGRVPSARYNAWRKRATQALWGQPLEFFDCPVMISMTFDESGRADLDNLPKGVLDHLVHHQIIPDDSKKYVRILSLGWGTVDGVLVEITRI